MTTTTSSREIDGKGRTVRELLTGRKYSIDYYQGNYNFDVAGSSGRFGTRTRHSPLGI